LSQPNIPNISPYISLTRYDATNLLLLSIAMEELGLAHILNAEGEKIQHFLKCKPLHLNDYLLINKSINKVLRSIVNSQITLLSKIEEISEFTEESNCQNCERCLCKEKKFNCKTYFTAR